MTGRIEIFSLKHQDRWIPQWMSETSRSVSCPEPLPSEEHSAVQECETPPVLPCENDHALQQFSQARRVNAIVFSNEDVPLSFLHNDFPVSFEFNNYTYPSATNAYEAQKFLGRPEIVSCFCHLNADQARIFSTEQHNLKNSTWYDKRVETMWNVLYAKFGQQALRQQLTETGQDYILFHSRYENMDIFWMKDSNGFGENRMGGLLMELRREFGGSGAVEPPWNLKELVPVLPSSYSKHAALNKSDYEIYDEFNVLNSAMCMQADLTQIAMLSNNAPLSRLLDKRAPFDATLVPLSSGRFINANFLLGGAFIGTQSPLFNTVEDFWEMVWEHDVPIVVMLNKLGEIGDFIYFPYKRGYRCTYGKVHLEVVEEPVFTTDPSWCESAHEEEPHAYIRREIKIWREGQEPRTVFHFQYLSWRDHHAAHPRAVASFVKDINHFRTQLKRGPTVLHCHVGIGRTSLMVIALNESTKFQSGEIDIPGCLKRLRSPTEGRCCCMLESSDQYLSCYKVLRHLEML